MLLILAQVVALTLTLDGYPTWEAADAAAACKKTEAPVACATRLRDLLRAELKNEKLKPAVSFLACTPDPSPSGPCMEAYVHVGCTPFATLLIESLARLGRVSAVALPEFDEAVRRISGSPMQTQNARAAAGATDRLDAAAALLSHESYDCRANGLALLGSSHTPQSCSRLAAYAATGPAAEQWNTVRALSACGADAVAGLDALLSRPLAPFPLIEAAQALGRIGTKAKPAEKRLTALADEHWSVEVRAEAAKAASVISKKKVVPRARSCIRTDGGEPGIRPVGELTRADDACTKKSGIALTVDGVCIEGFDGGEWGGVWKADGVEFAREPFSNPRRLFRLGTHVYVVQGMSHRGARGDLSELLHTPRGWRIEFVTELPGEALELWLDGEGRLMMHTVDDSRTDRCPQGMVIRFAPGERTFEVLR